MKKGKNLILLYIMEKQQDSMKIKRLIRQPEAANSLKTAQCVALCAA